MEYRKFGKAELNMSVLGFACGSVGRLMVCRKYKGMLKTTVDCALEAGINQVSSGQREKPDQIVLSNRNYRDIFRVSVGDLSIPVEICLTVWKAGKTCQIN